MAVMLLMLQLSIGYGKHLWSGIACLLSFAIEKSNLLYSQTQILSFFLLGSNMFTYTVLAMLLMSRR